MKLANNSARVRANLQNMARDIEHLLQDMSDATGEQVDTVRSRTRAGLRAARGRLGEMEHDTARRLRVAGERTQDYVRRNPWRVVGAAAAVAYLVSVLIRSRR